MFLYLTNSSATGYLAGCCSVEEAKRLTYIHADFTHSCKTPRNRRCCFSQQLTLNDFSCRYFKEQTPSSCFFTEYFIKNTFRSNHLMTLFEYMYALPGRLCDKYVWSPVAHTVGDCFDVHLFSVKSTNFKRAHNRM